MNTSSPFSRTMRATQSTTSSPSPAPATSRRHASLRRAGLYSVELIPRAKNDSLARGTPTASSCAAAATLGTATRSHCP